MSEPLVIGGLLSAYGLVWGVAVTHPVVAIIVLNMLALPTIFVFIGRAVEGILGGLIISLILLIIGIAIPPLLFLLIIWQSALLLVKWQKFIRNARFSIGAIVLYSVLFAVPPVARSTAVVMHLPRVLILFAMATLGVGIMLLTLAIYKAFGDERSETAIYALGFGWYFCVFVATFFVPGVDAPDGSGDA